MATVSSLTYYPVKGCAGVTVDRLEVTRTGPLHDRAFVIVDPDGVFLSQRVTARLAVVGVRVLHDGTKLALSAPGAGELLVDVDAEGPPAPLRVHNWDGVGIDQGDDPAAWFSEVLGRPVHLMRAPDSLVRQGSGLNPGEIRYHDSTALLVTSLSSLDGLNARILERGAEPVPMNRFRPNIVVTGWPEPHTEDQVRTMTAGDVEIGHGKRDIRCVVTVVDQALGVRSGPEPLRTLADYRREPEGGVSFGMKAAVLRPGTIHTGDQITVTEWL